MRTRLLWLAATASVAAVAYLVLRDTLAWQAAAAVKAVPVLCLAVAVAGSHRRWARWIVLGLVASAVGDITLAVPGDGSFLYGLGAFAAAHVAYTVGFVSADATLRGARSVPFVVWAALAVAVLAPRTGSVMVPVMGYIVLICAMMWRAAARVAPGAGRPAWWGLAGAVVFGVSDTSLAVKLFVTPFPGADLLVMATYWAGQLGIAASTAVLEE